MADDNQVLDYLREQFSRMHSRLDELSVTVREHGRRISHLEQQMGQLNASLQDHYAIVMQRLDNLSDRLARIERRLDLVEG